MPVHFPPGSSAAAIVLLVFWIHVAYFLKSRKQDWYVFEHEVGAFEKIFEKYAKLIELFIGLGAGAVVLIASFNSKPGAWRLASPLILLGSSVVFAIVCLTLIIFFYEEYSFNKQSYKRMKHILVNVFGFSAIWLFSVGYIWIGFAIGYQ